MASASDNSCKLPVKTNKRGASKSGDEYAFVYWINDGKDSSEEHQWDVYKKGDIQNKLQLYNPNLVDLIVYQGTGEKHMGVVLALSGYIGCLYITVYLHFVL